MNILEKRRSEHLDRVARHFDGITESCERYRSYHPYYHRMVSRFIGSIIPPGKRVLEVGCGFGNLLNQTAPSRGVGVEISRAMLNKARERHPHLTFVLADLLETDLNETFDYVILCNAVDYFSDVGLYLDKIRSLCHQETRLIFANFNPLWSWLVLLGSKLGWRSPDMKERNFLTMFDLQNMLQVHGYEVIDDGLRIFLPKHIPWISEILNAIVPRLPMVRHLCLMQYHVARLHVPRVSPLSCSVIVPCYNEEGNIRECIERIPQMGIRTEIVVVDDGSRDKTFEIVREMAKTNPNITLLRHSPNRGKGQAVKAGFEAAKGDVLMILDADMTVAPEELEKFFVTLQEGHAEFVNGTRMIYPMQNNAMRSLNYVGNKSFGIILSLIIGQRNTDVLCGTKAFFARDYKSFNMKGHSWGDFELLFAAARLRLKMVEMPIHYLERVAGESKMKPFRHGWELLKNCYIGLRDIY